jgi:hypothetical protein
VTGGIREQAIVFIFFVRSQDGSSERFIGEWAEKRGIRDKLFIATKASPSSISL